MKCSQCGAELPEGARFCSECGAKVTLSETCPNCDAILRAGARFCHACGASVSGAEGSGVSDSEASSKSDWLSKYGPFLFVPIFAGIVVLLFWVNRDPEPLQSQSNPQQQQQQQVPDMQAMNQVHATLERLKQRLQEDPTDVVAMDSLAQMYFIAGSFQKAIDYLNMHLQVEPDNRDVKITMAWAYHNLDQTARGISLLQEILADDPLYPDALYFLGELYAAQGRKQEAGELWQKVVDHYPDTRIAEMARQRIHETLHANGSGN